MTKESNANTNGHGWEHFYQKFDSLHGRASRQNWYGGDVAKAYLWARPKYPDDLLCEALRCLPHNRSSILELGCGPGIVTESIARLNLANSIVALDPSSTACELAKEAVVGGRNDANDVDIQIHNCTFEEYQLEDQRPFDMVVAATSFHWIDLDVACRKSAQALRDVDSSRLVLLWATPPQLKPNVIADLEEHVYKPMDDEHKLSDDVFTFLHRTAEQYISSFEQISEKVCASGYFHPTLMEQKQTRHISLYAIERYIALLSTLSPYIALSKSVREELFDRLRARLLKHHVVNDREELETEHMYSYHMFRKK